jgi:CheY-like chemotaxis protein
MRARPKILLVDDEQELLDLYREILSQLPSQPEIFTSASGARAIAMLESEPFTILVCDLNMPKMDGLQVLSIVRRKYPDLRTVVLTSVLDEQFRSRVYALGIDLFWQKPSSSEEIKQLLECLESLLGREPQSGFRGVQSKSLVDIIQLECISQNSTVLKITNGPLTGKIWVRTGEVIDAETEDAAGEEAFRRILSWRSGNFEALTPEPEREQRIFNSYQGLLLQTAQAHDEAQESPATGAGATAPEGQHGGPLSRFPGVEFILVLKPGPEIKFDARGLENAQPTADWSRQTLAKFRAIGELLQAGDLEQMECLGSGRHVSLAPRQEVDFCVGWKPNITLLEIHESTKKLTASWDS